MFSGAWTLEPAFKSRTETLGFASGLPVSRTVTLSKLFYVSVSQFLPLGDEIIVSVSYSVGTD